MQLLELNFLHKRLLQNLKQIFIYTRLVLITHEKYEN